MKINWIWLQIDCRAKVSHTMNYRLIIYLAQRRIFLLVFYSFAAGKEYLNEYNIQKDLLDTCYCNFNNNTTCIMYNGISWYHSLFKDKRSLFTIQILIKGNQAMFIKQDCFVETWSPMETYSSFSKDKHLFLFNHIYILNVPIHIKKNDFLILNS